MSEQVLLGEIALVTGASRGIGRAIALELGRLGATVIGTATSETGAAAIGEALSAAGVDGSGLVLDVADPASVENCLKEVGARHGTPTVLVNNAGITRDGLFIKVKDGEIVNKMSLEQWQQVIDVNLTGTFLCGREAAVQMIKTDSQGVIINISSISRHGNMGQTNYTATKAGVHAMAVTWAKELARYGIRSAAIAPGYIGTEMVMAMKEEARDKIAGMIPAKRLGKPEEIAKTAVFIFENDYINGRCLEIDGALRV